MKVSKKDREAAWSLLKQRSWLDELTLAEAEAQTEALGEWYYGANAIAEVAEAIATARAEGRREALEEAAELADSASRPEPRMDGSTVYGSPNMVKLAARIRALADQEGE